MTVNRTRRRQSTPPESGSPKSGSGISAAEIANLAGFLEDLEELDESPQADAEETAEALATSAPSLEAPPVSRPTPLEKSQKNPSQERPMTTAKPKTPRAAKANALALPQPTMSVMGRPVMPSEIEVVETITLSGGRPIAASNMDLYGSFLNGRPIEANHFTIESMLPGDRPVFSSEVEMMEDTMLPGGRPIMVSPAALMEASVLPGGRPIASNDIDDPAQLMGYLD